ncbi:zinc-dependent metalloprotease [Segatella baroniae]|uniref:zinc-dependent metalloprotease n=1 Tax=Segatella baroniae TaxID=305719 RepID=UPI0004261C4C|nr:zinc-dependent metalloprotease [Segatella baroniae]
MKRVIVALSLGLMIGTPVQAKKKKKVEAPKKEVRTPAKAGLFNVQHWKDKYYFQVPDSLLGRLFMVNTRYVSTPVDAGLYGGELANSQVLYWEKRGKELHLRANMYDTRVDSTDAIALAVRNASQDPIVYALKIDSTVTDTAGKKLYSVEVTNMFNADNSVFSIYNSLKDRFGITSFKKDLSYIDYIHTFPMNTEVVTVKTFGSKSTTKLPAGQETGNVTIKLNTSFVLLPKEPMAFRTFDPRVGYFTESFSEFGDNQQKAERRKIISRWRLEPKDVEAYKRGELVEPVKQIVYYIDPATPKKWRPYLIAGVEDWNKAFEAAGFKNAITAKEWPNDSTMSLEDARYSVIRYLASDIPNAYGPHVSDPRSGEIIESHIGWYHNVMSLLHDWYQTQAGAIDQRARKPKFDDELMGQLIRFVSSHEIGHTLGLRHNMGASSATPVDSLRNKAWVERHGHTASIMDYARFNYVAQPEDNIGEAGTFPRIGDYDKWAINWGYRCFPDSKGEKDERLTLNKMTIAKLKESRRYWFGGEGNDNDPKAQTEDLGDDAMKAGSYGIKNLKRIIKHLPEWNYEEGDMDENVRSAYRSLVQQMSRYANHVAANIGGGYHDFKSVEQPGETFTPVDRATQKRALAWLEENVFKEPTWLISEPYVRRLVRVPENNIFGIADRVLDKLTSAMTINLVSKHATGAGSYQPMELVNDLVGCLFRSTATGTKATLWTRHLQRRAVGNFIKAWKVTIVDEQRPYALAAIQQIKTRLQQARTADAATRAHYADLLQQIKIALSGMPTAKESKVGAAME